MKVEFLDKFYRDLTRPTGAKARKYLLATIEKKWKKPPI